MAKNTKQAAAVARCLMNPTTGRVFTWTETLSARPDLVECSPDGIPLKPVAVKLVRKAELDKAKAESLIAAGLSPTIETRDTFGAPNNPVRSESPVETGVVAGLNADLGGD